MSDQERPYSQSYNISSYSVSQNPASSEYRSGTSTSFPTQNPQAPTQQPQMLAYTYQHGRDPTYPLQMTNVMATPTSMLPPMRNSPMIGNVPIPQYMAQSVPSPMHMCTAPQGNYYTQAPALPQTMSVMGIQQPRFYAPILPPAPQTRHGIPRRRTEIKRRTKTGCLTCRGRRIKCDEGRPICAACIKSKRQCTYAEPSKGGTTSKQTQEATRENSSNQPPPSIAPVTSPPTVTAPVPVRTPLGAQPLQPLPATSAPTQSYSGYSYPTSISPTPSTPQVIATPPVATSSGTQPLRPLPTTSAPSNVYSQYDPSHFHS